MPVSLYVDHRLDRLAERLAECLRARTSDGPFASRQVVVPSLGVGRWLQQQVALHNGVCVGLEPEFAGRLLWAGLRTLIPELPARSPFDATRLRWQVLALIERMPAPEPDDPLEPLREAVARAGPAQRLAIATSVAGLFDRYLAWRRDWLAIWARGEQVVTRSAAGLGPNEAWQAWLWRALLAQMPDLADRHPYDRFGELIEHAPEQAREALRGRSVFVFGAPDLSPSQFELFGLLGEAMDVVFFVPDPCREQWSDLVDVRTRERARQKNPEQAWLYDGQPSLLGNWGRAQRDFVAQVLELQDRFGVQAHDDFRALPQPDAEDLDGAGAVDLAASDPAAGGEPRARDCLHALRTAIFLRDDSVWESIERPDDSIVVHAAHGAIRQAEVLHDELLCCFERIAGLQPSEVLVLCADVDAAAGALEAVLASAAPPRVIPFVIRGRTVRAEPLFDAVFGLWSLAEHGPDLPSIEAWLSNPAVIATTGATSTEIDALLAALVAAGARWGLDAGDGAMKHSFEQALDRLLLGAIVDRQHEMPMAGMLPVTQLTGSEALLLEPLVVLLDALRELRQLSAGSPQRAISDWVRCFGSIVERLFARAPMHEAAMGLLRDALGRLVDQASREPGLQIEAKAFALALEEELAAGAPAAAPSGAVTIAPLGALRGVPYRVVCLFGMDESAWPRRGGRRDFDLMLRAPRFGDRSARHDDRAVFLDAVLAARERLVVLFRGRDARDDAVLEPSTLVLELLAYLRARLGVGAASPLRRQMPVVADASFITEHALHPFSPRNFESNQTASHALPWLDVARVLARPLAQRAVDCPALARPALGQPADPTEPVEWSVDALVGALFDPIRDWMRHCLQVRLREVGAQVPRVESIWLRPDEALSVLERTLQARDSGASAQQVRAWLEADPCTGAAGIGRVQAGLLLEAADAIRQRAGGPHAAPERCNEPPAMSDPMIDVDLRIGAADRILGRLAAPDPDGTLRVLSAWPLNLLAVVRAWLHHAVLAAHGLRLDRTLLVAVDRSVSVRVDDPQAALRHAVRIARSLREAPPAALPRSCFKLWIDGAESKRTNWTHDERVQRLRKLIEAEEGEHQRPERSRLWQAAFWRDEMPDAKQVLEHGDALWEPILRCLEFEASNGGSRPQESL